MNSAEKSTSSSTSSHRARRRFGQNFLIDAHIIQGIIDAIAPRQADNIVEIGPGLGALTRPLLTQTHALTVLEIDRDLCARLQEQSQPGLRVIEADALSYEFRQLTDAGPLRIVGNLPYNIGTPLLIRFLAYLDVIEDIHVMLQKEVVDRLVARVGTRAYGRLSVLMQTGFNMTPILNVPPTAFNPAPQVTSAVVRLRPRSSNIDADELLHLSQATRLAFANKRKTLRNNLKAHVQPGALERAGIDPGARAETLSLAEFAALAKLIHTDAT